MKKKIKVLLVILLVIVIAIASYLVYVVKFKSYDVEDEAVEEIMEDPYILELPDGTIVTLDKEGNVIENSEQTQTAENEVTTNGTPAEGNKVGVNEQSKTAQSDTGSNANSNTTSTTGSDPAKQQTVGDIKNKYTPSFQALEAQADSKLNALVTRAKSEYKDRKANGESVDFGYFYNKYNNAAKQLETSTDNAFNGVLKATENELIAAGYTKEYAQSFVDDYNATKKARRDSLLSKVVGK